MLTTFEEKASANDSSISFTFLSLCLYSGLNNVKRLSQELLIAYDHKTGTFIPKLFLKFFALIYSKYILAFL